jgi:hypothetical protein
MLSIAGLTSSDVARALALQLPELSDSYRVRDQLGQVLTEVVEASGILSCPESAHVHARVNDRWRRPDAEGPDWLAVADVVGTEDAFRRAEPIGVDPRFASDARECFQGMLVVDFDFEDRLAARLGELVPDQLLEWYVDTEFFNQATPLLAGEQLSYAVEIAALTRVVMVPDQLREQRATRRDGTTDTRT